MSPYAKGAAYMGLALVTPVSGWVGYQLGGIIDRHSATQWAALVGLLIGCAAGMYETYREALKIEGFDKPGGKGGGAEPE